MNLTGQVVKTTGKELSGELGIVLAHNSDGGNQWQDASPVKKGNCLVLSAKGSKYNICSWLPTGIRHHLHILPEKSIEVVSKVLVSEHPTLFNLISNISIFANVDLKIGPARLAANQQGIVSSFEPNTSEHAWVTRWYKDDGRTFSLTINPATRGLSFGCPHSKYRFTPCESWNVAKQISHGEIGTILTNWQNPGDVRWALSSTEGDTVYVHPGDLITRSGPYLVTLGGPRKSRIEGAGFLLTKYPYPFFGPGKKVFVKGEVEFRRRSLRGLQATVLLSSDSDGDVGLEFEQDLKAGSLEGIGKSGHCLFVRADQIEECKSSK